MSSVELSEETLRRLMEMKNHWSYTYRRVTNPDVVKMIEEFKLRVFGYNSYTPVDEIEEIAKSKSREQLEKENERFANGIRELLKKDYDFEPEYTLDEHIRKMIEVIDQGDEIPPPMF
ncbi:MAG: hypothetical protein V3V92_05620 [Candidatus Hydrothermarchaeales archaeon]